MFNVHNVVAMDQTQLIENIDYSLYGSQVEPLLEGLRAEGSTTLEHICQERLPDLYNLHLRGRERFFMTCKSDMNTGKTHQIKSVINGFSSHAEDNGYQFNVLFITPRCSFASFVVANFNGFEDYRECERPFSYRLYPRFVVQLQSLKHFERMEIDTTGFDGYDLLVLDEIRSLSEELFSVYTDKSGEVFTYLSKIIRAIPRVLCFDAHLSHGMIKVLYDIERLHERRDRLCILNSYAPKSHRMIIYRKCLYNMSVLRLFKQNLFKSNNFETYKTVFYTNKIADIVLPDGKNDLHDLYTDLYLQSIKTDKTPYKDDIIVALLDSLERREKVCAVCLTKKQCKLITTLVEKLGYTVKSVTGNSEESEKSRFASDPDTFVKDCDMFIYNTAFTVGMNISSQCPYFDTQFVFIECYQNVAGPAAFVQTLRRVRQLKSKTYHVVLMDNSRDSEVNDLEELLDCPVDEAFKKVMLMAKLEKNIPKYPKLFMALFVRLMSNMCTLHLNQFGLQKTVLHESECHSYQYKYKDYQHFTQGFIFEQKPYITEKLNIYLSNVWHYLEQNSFFSSTVINNFDPFIRSVDGMERAECICRICEWLTKSFSVFYTFLFEKRECDDIRAYFDHEVQRFHKSCTVKDLEQFRLLFFNLRICSDTTGTTIYHLNEDRYQAFLLLFQSVIEGCYRRFVQEIIHPSYSTHKLFVILIDKCCSIAITNRQYDVKNICIFKRLIDFGKYVDFGVKQLL